MHDPRVGRFFAVDPLTSKYPFYSPYSFSGNKVINSRELEGLEELVVILDQVNKLPYVRGTNGEDVLQEVTAIVSKKTGILLIDKSYNMAAKELSKGRLMASNDKVYTTSRMTEQTVHLIDGTKIEGVVRGVNFGFKLDGEVITTKEINQLEALSRSGDGKAFMMGGKILSEFVGNLMVMWDVANNIVKEGELDPLVFTPLEPVSGIIKEEANQQMREIVEGVIQNFEVSKSLGVDATMSYIKDWNNILKDYKLMSVSSNAVSKILNGEINTYGQLRDVIDEENYSDQTSAILINNSYQDKLLIEAIFIDVQTIKE